MANTSFTRDEAILALDVLHFADKLRLNKESHEIAELSELLNELPIIPLSARRENFRSKGGVNGQLANLGQVITKVKRTLMSVRFSMRLPMSSTEKKTSCIKLHVL